MRAILIGALAMHPEDKVFAKKVPIPEALERFGFAKEGGAFVLRTSLPGPGFDLTVKVLLSGKVEGRAVDPDTGDEFVQLHAAEPRGAFASQVQDEYVRLLSRIASECFRERRFVTDQGCRIAAKLKEAYGDEPDNPFCDMDAGAFRISEKGKWYALITQVPRANLQKEGNNAGEGKGSPLVEIIDVKASPEDIPELVKRDGIYPAWHMNKRHWIAVTLEDSVDDQSLMELIARSRELVIAKNGKSSKR
jgi:predicted DNA-binding protein (MmcQ/YjbR family)